MRLAIPAALLTAASFAALPPARADDTTYKLDKIEINGVKSVPADQLRAGLNLHRGDTVTTGDLVANQEVLSKELETAHVLGKVTTSMRNKNNGHIDAIYTVDDQGVQTPTVVHMAPKLKTQAFVGNATVATDVLEAATGLKPGDELSDAKIQAAQAAIGDAYKKAKAPVDLNVSGSIKQSAEGADITWTITETKPSKKKKKNTDDENGVQGEY